MLDIVSTESKSENDYNETQKLFFEIDARIDQLTYLK